MPGKRGRGLRISREAWLFAAAGVCVLAGASFNVQGFSGPTGVIAIAAGAAAFAAGFIRHRRGPAVGLLVAGLVLHGIKARLFGTSAAFININLVGVVGLALGGGMAQIAYTHVTESIRRRAEELERLNAQLEEQRRVFLAATEEFALGDADPEEISSHLARVTGAGFCCLYLAGPDRKQFMPQLPGVGFEQSRPPTLTRLRGMPDPIFDAIDAKQPIYLDTPDQLATSRRLLPPNFRVDNLLIVPIAVEDQLAGFVLVGNRRGGFSPDLRRLAATLTSQAGVVLTSQSIVAQSKEDAVRLSVLTEITTRALDMDFEEVLELLVEKSREVVRHDAAQVLLLDPAGTYTILGRLASPAPMADTPLESILHEGKVIVRRLISAGDGLYSGLKVSSEGAQVSEALIPVKTRGAVSAVLCLGRRGGLSFGDRDLPVLNELARIVGLAVDAAAQPRKATEPARELGSLGSGLAEIGASPGSDQALLMLLRWAVRLADAEAGAVLLSDGGRLRIRSVQGWERQVAAGVTLDLAGDLCREVLESGQPISTQITPGPSGQISVLCLALRTPAQRLGVLFLANHSAGRMFSDEHLRQVSELANGAAGIVAAEMALGTQQHEILTVLIGFAAALDARSPYTSGRSQKVAEYAMAIAQEIGYATHDPAAARRLHQGCLIHDIGQVVIPDTVWQKPGRLTRAESSLIHAHPVVGFDLVKNLPMLSDELIIIRSHHERYDGRGYPDGRSGPDLPIFAWIASAADALEAMTGERPHRRPLDLENAVAEFQRASGSQFHPDVVRAISACAAKRTIVLRTAVEAPAGAS